MFWNTPPVTFGNLRFYAWAAVIMFALTLAAVGLTNLIAPDRDTDSQQHRVTPAHHSDAPTPTSRQKDALATE